MKTEAKHISKHRKMTPRRYKGLEPYHPSQYPCHRYAPSKEAGGRFPAAGPSFIAHFTFYPGHGFEFRGGEPPARENINAALQPNK